MRLLLRVKEDFGAIDYTRRHRQPSIDGCREDPSIVVVNVFANQIDPARGMGKPLRLMAILPDKTLHTSLECLALIPKATRHDASLLGWSAPMGTLIASMVCDRFYPGVHGLENRPKPARCVHRIAIDAPERERQSPDALA